MLQGMFAVTLCVAVAVGTMSSAQSLAKVGGPKEVPPASFKGDQFVDSRGCIFVRAGISGTTSWVPRIGADHKVLCGYPPTFGAREAIPVAPDSTAVAAASPAPAAKPAQAATAAAAPAPRATAPAAVVADATPGCPANAPYGRIETAADGRTILKCSSRRSAAAAPAPAPAPAPVVVAAAPAPRAPAPVAAPAPRVAAAAPAPTVVPAAMPARSVPARVVSTGGPGPGRVSCPASMPVLVRVPLTNGGSALLCTPGERPIVVAAAPTYPPGSGLAPSISPPGSGRTATAAATGTAPRASAGSTAVASADAMPPLPPGYKRAWKDDRLNPYRGKGTAAGWAQQDQVWTRTTPAKPVVTTKPYVPPTGAVTVSTRSAPATAAPRVTVSTRSSPAPAATGRSYVQVGTFGVPANAQGAAGKLSALGLPLATSKTTRNGKALQIVLAGPFASTAEAQAALAQARKAGFPDAFLR